MGRGIPRTESGRWTESSARSALKELSDSGMSTAAFARSKGISSQRVWYWRKRLGRIAPVSFVPVVLPVATKAAARRCDIEIVCGEVVVRVREDIDVEHLARIVVALSEARRRRC